MPRRKRTAAGRPAPKPAPPLTAELAARFWSKVKIAGPDECWEWLAYKDRGYGRFMVHGGEKPLAFKAHRLSYAWLVGETEPDLQLDHVCRNPSCVNPAHLEPVTNRENGLRGVSFAAENAKKTHCKHGHEFTPENTARDARGWRICRACRQRRNDASNAKRRTEWAAA